MYNTYTITSTHKPETTFSKDIVAADEEEAINIFCKYLSYTSYEEFLFYYGEGKLKIVASSPCVGLDQNGEFK